MSTITINLFPKGAYPISKIKRDAFEVGSTLGHNLSIKYGHSVTNKSPKLVAGLGPCVGLTLFTPSDKFVAHSAPELDEPSLVSKFLGKKIHEIREKSRCADDEVSAVIYGGIAFDGENPASEMSCALVDKMEEACRVEGVEPTIITGQYSNGLTSRLDSYIGNRQITMWSKMFDGVNLSPDATKAEVQKVLEDLFEYVKIPQQTLLKVLENLPYKTNHLSK